MGVVTVDAPGRQQAWHEVIVAGPPDVVHHLVVAPLIDRIADAAAGLVERLTPAGLLELPGASRSAAFERGEDPFRIVDLIERGGTLGAGAPAAAAVGSRETHVRE